MAITESSTEAKKAQYTFAKVFLCKSFSSVTLLVGNVYIYATRFYSLGGIIHETYSVAMGAMVEGNIVNALNLSDPKKGYWLAMAIASKHQAVLEVL